MLKINKSRYIALFLVDRFSKKLFSTDYVNINIFAIFFSIDFAQWKSVGLPHIASCNLKQFEGNCLFDKCSVTSRSYYNNTLNYI